MHSIVVYAPHWIGDGVLSLAALRSLRAEYPDSRITVFARPWVKELYDLCEEVTDTLGYEPSDGIRGFMRAVGELRKSSYDLGVVFPNAFRAALMFFFAGIPERWGYGTDGRRFLLTKTVPPAPRPFGRHQVFYYLDLLRGLGVRPVESNEPDIQLSANASMIGEAAELLKGCGWDGKSPLVGIHPGSTNSRAKRWFAARFAEVGRRFVDSHDAQLVIFGGPDERDLAQAVIAELDDSVVVDVSAKTSLGSLMGALSHLGMFVSNDSGPMHLAAALRVPTAAVFGPTDDRETGPFTRRAKVVREVVDCSPCLFRDCPIDHRCMDRVTAAVVYDRATDLLAELDQEAEPVSSASENSRGSTV